MDKGLELVGISLFRNKYLEVFKVEYVQYFDEFGLVLFGVGIFVDGVYQLGEGSGVEGFRQSVSVVVGL